MELKFDRNKAFSRSIGWITQSELDILGTKKVAIAGLGGVGGQYCEVLARLGIEHFNIADMDQFSIENLNRQAGAYVSTFNCFKSDVLERKIKDINPNAKVKVFSDGVHSENMDEFLDGVDLYVDGLDFFVLDLREELFNKIKTKNIPGVTIAPVGMGASSLVFDSKSMSFKNYFGLHTARSLKEKAMLFAVGLTPSLMQRHYVVSKQNLDFDKKKAPSTPMGIQLCGGMMGTIVLKLLLNRGSIARAPKSLHYDAYLGKFKKTYLWMGYRNPLQKIKLLFMKRLLDRISQGN